MMFLDANFCEQTAGFALPIITDVFQGIGLVCCFSMNYFLSTYSHGVKNYHKSTGGAGGGLIASIEFCCSSRNKAGEGSKLKFIITKISIQG